VPLGYPVAEKEVLLLDDDGRPVAPGVPGEIVIRSKYLAVGYWRQPELTRAAFLPDPADGAMRRYVTGDLGVMAADGCLTHLGRKDFQVKIRGTRVETAEIEVVLSRLEGVKSSVVHALPDRRGEPRLVAYVIPSPGAPPTIPAMRRHLSETLPEVMVPSSFVFLEEFPLLPNGKIDRRALPPPTGQRPRGPVVGPRHPLEAQIVGIWRELLDVPEVGVHDDFFELGGHSLLAARLMQRLETEVGRALPLTTLFSAPTVAGLADAVQRDEPLGNDLLEPVRAEGTEPPLFFFHGDYNGGGFYSRTLARALPAEQPFYAVHPHPLTSRPIPDTVSAMVTELVTAIRAVRPRGPYRLGGHCNGGLVAFEVARRLAAEGEVVDGVVIIDASARNVRFRPLSRLTRGLAWVGRLDARAEAALFLAVRDRAISLAWRFAEWRRRRARGEPARGRRPRSGEDLDLVAGPRAWAESERVERFRAVVRRYVPEPYGGAVSLLVPVGRPAPRRDLWWSRVAPRVSVHAVPGAHLTSITDHGAAVAERMRACLAKEGPRRPD
jgi:thioesterase domain-containing protein/acyl carrier protein